MEMLGVISSVATLILFIIYFIGRVISIIIEKNIKFEEINIYTDEKDMPKNIKIVDEFKCNEDSMDILILTPNTKSYNWIKVYECDINRKNGNIKKTKKLYETNRIYNDTSFRLDTIILCAIPKYLIEFERSDYMRGVLNLTTNGKNGVQEEMLRFSHTFKSIIYYLFK